MTPYYQQDRITIYHGDSREVLPTLGAVDAVITDPPYGLGNTTARARPTNYQRSKGMSPREWDRVPAHVGGLLSLASIVVIWGGNYFSLPPSRGWLTWFKPDAPPSMAQFEMAWTNRDMNAKQISQSVSATNSERVGHPTQKPLRVMTWCLEVCGVLPGACVLDPYMGSGTTLVAAKVSGRPAIGIEIEERYCEIAANRLAQGVLFGAGGVA